MGVVLYIMMSGQFPFCGDTDEAYYKNVLEQELEFPASEWAKVSVDAVDLIKGLLDRDPQTRMRPDEALRHKWLNDPSSAVREEPEPAAGAAADAPPPKTLRFGQKKTPSEILAKIEGRKGG